MARLSMEDIKSRLSALGERIGDEDTLLEYISDIQKDYDEIFSAEELETEIRTEHQKLKEENAALKVKVEDLKQKYVQRFLTGEDIIHQQQQDVKRDAEEVTFQDLFNEREG